MAFPPARNASCGGGRLHFFPHHQGLRLPSSSRIKTLSLEKIVDRRQRVTLSAQYSQTRDLFTSRFQDSLQNLPKLVDDIVQTSISTGPRGAVRLAQGIQAVIGVGSEWLTDASRVIVIDDISNDLSICRDPFDNFELKIQEATSPENELLLKSTFKRFLQPDNDPGRLPDRRFRERSNTCNDCKFPRELGSLPVNLLPERFKTSRRPILSIQSGMSLQVIAPYIKLRAHSEPLDCVGYSTDEHILAQIYGPKEEAVSNPIRNLSRKSILPLE